MGETTSETMNGIVVEAVCSQPPAQIQRAKRQKAKMEAVGNPAAFTSKVWALRALVFDRRLRADRLYNF